ncbi:MAG: hypothetical protein VKI63_06480 [Cyanobium sp.]|nr:hypothetical protein [Cyanobium sp.]
MMRALLGRWLRRLAQGINPRAPFKADNGTATNAGTNSGLKLPDLADPDRAPTADRQTIPSQPWLDVRERALGKSLATLRSEALYSLGALHAAHLAAAAVFDDRRLSAALDQRRGGAVADDISIKLAEAASIWHRDSASLGVALTAVGATQVPDLTLAEALQVDRQEAESLEMMVEGYQIELKRQILEEADP